MLKQMRTNTKWIIIIVTVGFIGMIVFQWGMDIGSQRQGVQAGVVGRINDVEIKYDYYDQLVRNQQDMLGADQQMTLDQSRMIHEKVWNFIVTNTLIEQEIEKLEITFTDKELLSYMLTVPVPIAYQAPIFMEDDTFSPAKYQAFIQNPANLSDPQRRQLLDYIEMQARQVLPRAKLQQSLENSIIIKDSEVRERWLRENEQRKIDWFFINTSVFESYPDTVYPEDLRMYYEEHKDDYRHEEMRSLDAVFFELIPTAADTTEVLERAKLLTERARSGEDFSEFANGYSEDPGNTDSNGAKLGGDLGFFGRGAMTKEFEDVAFSLKSGEISEPFLTRFGCHIVKVDSMKYKEDSKEIDEVKARHILLRIEPSGLTQETVENKVRAFYESVNSGMDFNLKVQMDSLQVVKTPLFLKESQYIPSIGNNTQLLANRSFRAKKGDLLPIYTTDTGYFVIKVSEIMEASISPFEDVESRIAEDVRKEMRAKYAENYCSRVSENLKEGMNLSDAVKAVADTLISTTVKTETVNRAQFISGLGSMNPFIVGVFTLENTGNNTGTVITDNGSGIAVLLEKIPVDEKRFEEEKNQLKERLENELKSDLMSRYIDHLVKNARIVDNRDLFLTL